MLFSNMDFKFAHFTNFDFGSLEIEKGWANLSKITKCSISLANFHFMYLKGLCFKYGTYFCSFCV